MNSFNMRISIKCSLAFINTLSVVVAIFYKTDDNDMNRIYFILKFNKIHFENNTEYWVIDAPNFRLRGMIGKIAYHKSNHMVFLLDFLHHQNNILQNDLSTHDQPSMWPGTIIRFQRFGPFIPRCTNRSMNYSQSFADNMMQLGSFLYL